MAEILDQLKLADSKPEEAASYIGNSKVFGIAPDAYKNLKSELDPTIAELKLPTQSTPGVASYLSQSPEHASLVKEDITPLSRAESTLKKAGNQINGIDLNKQLADLKTKKLADPKNFTDDDDTNMVLLEEKVKDLNQFPIDKPGRNKAMIDKYLGFETQEAEKSSINNFNAAASGIAGVLSNAGKIPALLYDGAQFLATGLSGTAPDPNDHGPEWLRDNTVVKTFSEMQQKFAAGTPEISKSFTQAAADGASAGELAEIAKVQFLANAPNQAALIAATMMAGPAAGLIFAGVTSAADKNYQNQKNGMSPTESIPSAALHGGIEAGMEKLGTLKFIKNWEKVLTTSLGNETGKKVFTNMMKSVFAGIATNATEEAATTAAQGFSDYIFGIREFSKEDLKKLAVESVDSGIQGGLSGGLLQAPAVIAKSTSNILENHTKKSNTQEALNVLRFDDMVGQVIDQFKQTKVQQLSPEESKNILKKMTDNSGIKKIWVDKEGLNRFAKTPEKQEKVRQLIDPTGQAAKELNAPVQIEPHEFIALQMEFPEVADLAKLSPEGASVEQARQYLTDVQVANEQRVQLLNKLGVSTELADSKILEDALSPEPPSRVYPEQDVFGEEEYLDQTKLDTAMKDFMPDGERKGYLEKQLKAKEEVVQNINDSAEYELEQVIDIQQQDLMDMEMDAQLERTSNNPNFEIVDKFTKTFDIVPDQRFNNLEDMKAPHKKKGFSPLAIDPRLLDDNVREALVNDPQMIEHKVFVEGGISPDDAARLLGVESGDKLLSILRQTPSREKVAQGRTIAREEGIRQQAKESVGLNEVGIIKAYQATLVNAIETLNIMKEKFWPATKAGIKRIALNPPSVKAILYDAKKSISKTKIGDLNVNQWKVAERKNKKIAVDAILKNQPEKAFTFQKGVAQSIALTKETSLAIGKVNRVVKFAKRFKSASVQQELKDAGKFYVDAANEVLEVYNLTSRKKDAEIRGAFNKWAKSVAEGNGQIFTVPEAMDDQRTKLSEMTVEEVELAHDKLQFILHLAKMKNRLQLKHDNIKSLQTMEALGDLLETEAKKVFDYDESRNDTLQDGSKDTLDKPREWLLNSKSSLERGQFVILKFDNNNINGTLNELLYRPFVDADNNKKTLLAGVEKQMKSLIEAFGKEEFDNLASDFVVVPEFANVPGLNGKISKAQLLAMELNYGNEGNIDRLTNFGITQEVVREVLDRELQDKHTAFAQNIWNIYKSFEGKISALEKRTEGIESKMVEAKPFIARGKEYSGGYYPIAYQGDSTKTMQEKLLGKGEIDRLARFKKNFNAQAMTEQGHLEARTGSDKLLDLNLNVLGFSLNQMVHDLTHREAIMDASKLLADPKIKRSIISATGKEGYNNIGEMVLGISDSILNDGYDQSTSWLTTLSYLGSGLQTVALGFKASSILIQPAAIGMAIDRMGTASGGKYVLKTLNLVKNNPQLIGAFFQLAEDLNPSIREFTEDIGNNPAGTLNELLPDKHIPLISPLKNTQELINDWAFTGLAQMDKLNKVLVTLSAYQQAMEGEASGVEKGNHEQAVRYASNLVELTQTYNEQRNLAPIQRNKYLKWMTFFFNDLNNVYNAGINRSRLVREHSSEANEAFKEGDFKKGSLKTLAALGATASFTMMLVAIKTYENLIKGQKTPLDDEEKDPKKALANLGKYYLGSVADSLIGTLPLLRDTSFASDKFWEKKKTVDLPIDSTLGTFATAYSGIHTYLGFFNEHRDLNMQEKKAMIVALGVLTKTPTGVIWDYGFKPKDKNPGLFKKIEKQITKIEKWYETATDPGVTPEFMQELKTIKNQIAPPEAVVPENALDVLKQIESESNPAKYNADTGAAGVYQFTETQWNKIMKDAPELGLTENGRVSQKTEQQDRAMKWQVEKNTEYLQAVGLPVNNDNLYISNLLGIDKAAKVLEAQNNSKAVILVEKDFLKANGLSKNITIREFKDWASRKVVKAEFENEERLTKETNK